MSSRGDVVAGVAAGMEKGHLGMASVARIAAVGALGNTWGFVVAARLADHTCGVDHGQKEKPQTRESLTEGCGMRWGDTGAIATARQP